MQIEFPRGETYLKNPPSHKYESGCPQRRGWIGNNMKLVAADHSSSSLGEEKEKIKIIWI